MGSQVPRLLYEQDNVFLLFFLFGVAIERVGDQLVDTCLASLFHFLSPIPLVKLEIVRYFLVDRWNLPNSNPFSLSLSFLESLFDFELCWRSFLERGHRRSSFFFLFFKDLFSSIDSVVWDNAIRTTKRERLNGNFVY